MNASQPPKFFPTQIVAGCVVENQMDVNALKERARALRGNGHLQSALEIYLFLADGDPSLDEGWLAVQIAECYEHLGRMIEAKYWAGRASEANPELRDRPSVGDRLGKLDVNDITRAPSPTGWVSAGDEDDVRETEHILAELPGGLELIRWFGGQFGFHDAEIAALKLDREGPSCLEFFLPGRGQPTRVRFILTDWIDTSLNGFSHQNVIGDLILRRTKHRHIEPWERGVGLTAGQFEIELMPIFGAYGTIRASIDRVEIEAL